MFPQSGNTINYISIDTPSQIECHQLNDIQFYLPFEFMKDIYTLEFIKNLEFIKGPQIVPHDLSF